MLRNPLLIQDEPIDSFALEAFNIFGMSNYLSGFITKFNDVLTTKLIPFITPKSDHEIAVKILTNYTRTQLEHFTVYTPEYVSGQIVPYLKTLTEVMTELSNVEQKLLVPLEKWVANMLTDPTYSEKTWVAIPTKDNSVEKHTEELHKFFNESSGDDVCFKTFEQVYVDLNGFKEADKLIEPLVALSAKILDGKLTARAKNLSATIMRLTENKNSANSLSELPDTKVKPIIDITLQAARELELLAIVMFQIRCVSYSQKQSTKKIIDQLAK